MSSTAPVLLTIAAACVVVVALLASARRRGTTKHLEGMARRNRHPERPFAGVRFFGRYSG